MSVLCSLFELRQDRLDCRKGSGISFRQVRRDLIAGRQRVAKQVAECGVVRASRNLLSLIKKLSVLPGFPIWLKRECAEACAWEKLLPVAE
jgi:hypothetical protein